MYVQRTSILSRTSVALAASAVLLLAPPAIAHGPSETTTFVSPLPTFPFTSQITFVSLFPPPVGVSIVHATLDLTWNSDGTFPASDLLLHYEISVDGVIRDLVVTGADLGWGSGPGTYTGSIDTDILNGQTVQGGLFGTKLELDIATSTGFGGVTGQFTSASELRLEMATSFRNENQAFNVSLSAGGTQVLALDAPASEAGRLYWIFGSGTGTSPGIAGPAGTLPLNFDPYFNFTLLHPNKHIKPSVGFLNLEGNASATLTIPAGSDPGLSGMQLDHAYAVFDFPGTGATTYVSNPLVLRLTP